MVGRFTRTVALLIAHVLLLLTLTLGWSFPTAAQILSDLSWSENDIRTESYIPVFTSGNLECNRQICSGLTQKLKEKELKPLYLWKK